MTNRSIEVRPITPHLGAEVFGVDLATPLDATEKQAVHQALLAHQVIFFRDQDLDLPSQVAFGKLFGELHAHPNREGPQGFREVLPIHIDANSKRVPGEDWHSDVSCDVEPPMGSILHLQTVPEVGGDTLFASQYAAYDALSERMKAYLHGLTALHSGDHIYRSQNIRDSVTETGKVYPSAVHPVVRTHPETGRKALFVNGYFTLRVNELPEPESRTVLAFLYAHATRPEFQLRFRWRKNSVAFWDNRCVQHMALWDYYPHTRSGFRVTVKGDRPV
jgi:taurine dioxygenase